MKNFPRWMKIILISVMLILLQAGLWYSLVQSKGLETRISETLNELVSWSVIGGILVCFGIVLCLMLLWNLQLKRKVAKAMNDLQQREQRLKAQNELLLTLMKSEKMFLCDFNSVVQEITETCGQLLGTERTSVWLYAEDSETIRCIDLYELSAKCHSEGGELHSVDFPKYTSSNRLGQIISASNVYADPRTAEIPESYYREYDIRSLIDFPIWLGQQVRGILCFEATGQEHIWTPEEERLANIMAAMVSLGFEISARKRTEDELRLAEFSIENSGLPTIWFDSSSRIVRVNQAVCQSLDYTPDELLKLSVKDIDPNYDSKGKWLSIWEEIKKYDRYLVFETRHRRKDGSTFPVEVVSRYFNYNGLELSYSFARDITSRKQAEKSLRESENRFRFMMEQSPFSIMVFSPEGEVLQVNDAYVWLWGVSKEKIKEFKVLKDPQVKRLGILPMILRAFAGEQISIPVVEYNMGETFEGGNRKIVQGDLYPIKDENGEILYIILVYQDITGRKQTEEIIREWKDRYELIVAASGQVAYDYYILTGTIVWGSTMEKVFGYSPDELGGGISQWINWLYPDDKEATLKSLNEAEATCVYWDTQYRLRHKNGNYVWIRDRGFFIPDSTGKAIRQLGMLEDISERKRAEEALQESEAKYRLIIDHSSDLIWNLNRDGIFTYVSSSWKRVTGYEPDSICGKSFQPLVYPEDVPVCQEYMKKIIESKDIVSGPEYRVLHVDGTWHWHTATCNPVLDAKGEFVSMVGVSRDISEKRRTEEALHKNEAILRSLYAATPAGVILLKDRMLHSVNNALCKITGYSEEELLGQCSRLIYPNEETFLSAGQKLYDQMEQEGLGVIETNLMRKDGTLIDALVCLSPLDLSDMKAGVCATVLDITERKRVEKVLNENEKLLRSLFASTPIGIGLLENRVFFNVNVSLCKMTGYAEEELLGQNTRILYPSEENYIHVGREIYGQMENEGQGMIEAQFQRKDGTLFDVLLCLNPFDPTNMRGKVCATILDITKRKRVEKALNENEKLLRSLFASIPVGIGLLENRGFFKVNTSLCKMTGYTEDELLGQKTRILYPSEEDYIRVGQELYGQVERDGYGIIESKLQRKDGRLFDVLLCLSPFDSADMSGKVCSTILDITGRKRAESALLESESNLRKEQEFRQLILDTSPAFIVAIDSMGKTLLMNKALLDALEYTSEEIVEADYLTAFFPGEDRERVHGIIQKILQEKKETVIENRIRSKSGRTYIVEWHGRTVLHDESKFDFIVGVGVDITERVRAEEERKKLQDQLAQAQKMESIGRLAGGVAHDFNNMLGVIQGHAELCIKKIKSEGPLFTNLKEIEKAAKRSADLTRQLLGFARKQTIAPKVLDLNESIEGMLKMLRRLIGEDINLAWIPGLDLWPVMIDPSQVDQILANLCVNARDAISGIGRISIETEKAVFNEEYCLIHSGFISGEYVLISVSDDGCGMDKEIQEKIFEPFFTTKELGQGTGLGLATVYGILKQNNGFINVYSELGKGSTFKIYLPRYYGDSTEIQNTGVEIALQGGSETILLVEDEPMTLELSQVMLKELGYRVIIANTPVEAIQLARKHADEIHLLITDVIMPEMNGRNLAEKLQSLYPNIKCLFMSGYTANIIAHRGILDAGVHFIQKPFSMSQLALKTREVLDVK